MTNAIWTIAVSFFLLIGVVVPHASADWINLTGAETAPNIAEITVLDDRVTVRLEVYIGDLETFKDLIPDRLLREDAPTRAPLSDRLTHFGTEVFRVLAPDGSPLTVEARLIEPRTRVDRKSPYAGMINPQTRRRAPEPPEDKRVLYAELDYLFEGKPEYLTFVPPVDENGAATANVGFIAYHKAVPIIDFRYLSGPAKVTLDWRDPWYTKFDNPNLKRHHKSALMSFLYVEPREVRHEVLIRVRDLQEWTDLGLSGEGTITADEQTEVKNRAHTFFAERNPLQMDGEPFEPSASRAEFLKISLSGLQVIEDDQPLDLSTAIVGIILSYPVEGLPQNVSVKWELFNDWIEDIPATMTDPAGPLLSKITATDPVIEWQNFLLKYEEPKVTPLVLDDGRSIDVPILSLALFVLCLGAGVLVVRPMVLSRPAWVAALVLSGAVCRAVLPDCHHSSAQSVRGGPGRKDHRADRHGCTEQRQRRLC